MSRSADWPPLCGSDPTPGDSEAVRTLGDRYANTALDIARQAANLQRLGSYTGWESDAGEAFSEHARELAGKLLDAQHRYEVTGSQLRIWAGEVGAEGSLSDVQDRSEALRREAQAAEAARAANAPAPSGPVNPDAPPPTAGELAAQSRRTEAYDAAGTTLERCRTDLVDVIEDRDRVANRVAGMIRDVVDDDLKDSWWERRKNDVAGIASRLDGIADVLGYIATAMALASMFIPGVNLLVAAAILTVVALSAHSLLTATGNGSWLDVGLDAFALATFGAGRLLTSGGRVLGVTVRGAKPAMASLRTVSAPRVASAVAKTTRAATRVRRVALTPLLHNPATMIAARAEHTALKALAPAAAAQAKAATLADRLVNFSRLSNLRAADAEVGHMLSTLKALRPYSLESSVAPSFRAAEAAVGLAQKTAQAGLAMDVADKLGAFNFAKTAPAFNLQPGGSW